ncbi:hypothetical protein C6I20_07740 [Aeromicrobium sp. A1-2]|uniref:hypothetical protein n=1 Tax=Aeromicrobium sp. A1-2 TaxID=2107713 RepID=UPI000E4F9588|nr:hypothetical protein [Aeromicrobium sp. A1-2]AXT85086.1 hypothetical protein C6I20_07740 [Aeromicrobium sp. A1-2]
MRYEFAPGGADAAQAWWDAVAGTGAIAPSGQIRAHQITGSASHMIVEVPNALLCCTKAPATGFDPKSGTHHWQLAVDVESDESALIRVTSPAGINTELRCPEKLIDDLVWYDAEGDAAVRLVRAMSELDELNGHLGWPAELASALQSNAKLVSSSASALDSASRSVRSQRPMTEADVQRLLGSDAAMVDALALLRDLRMRGNLISHTSAVGSANLRALIGDHHATVAEQLLANVTRERAQHDHDLTLLGYAIDQLEATQARTTQLFERSRYIIDVAREAAGAIQGALFAAVGIAFTVVQVLALPNVHVSEAVNRETPLVIVASGALTFILGILLSRRTIGKRKLFWGSLIGGLACPLLVLAARIAF